MVNFDSKEFKNIFEKHLLDKFNSIIPDIKQAIIDKFKDELVDVVSDPDSKTNPNLYVDDFSLRLDKFEYIEKDSSSITIVVPDEENFDFSGRLRVIETITQGLSGIYVEVNEEDYIAIFNKRPINEDPIDEYVSPKERIYLMRYTPRIRKAEKSLNKKFVRYPFSNTPPIKVLDAGDKYVEDNMDIWIEETLEESQVEFVKKYK